MQELRILRRERPAAAAASADLLVGVYSEVLAGCRHKNGANAFATRLLPLAKEAALLALQEGGADVGVQREAKSVLRALARTGDADGAVRLLGALCDVHAKEGQAAPVVDEQLFFLAIRCCGAAAAAAPSSQQQKLGAVEGLLERMRALRVARSPFVYSAAFKAYAGGGAAWLPQVEALAAEMLAPPKPRRGRKGPRRESGSPQLGAPSVSLDLVALNSLLDAYARCGDAAQARALLERMAGNAAAAVAAASEDGEEEQGQRAPAGAGAGAGVVLLLPRPDAVSYNIVLRALGEQGDAPGALSLYDRMRAGAGTAPDAVTVNTLVAACARAGSLGKALGVLRSSPVPASVEGYSALMHTFASRGDVQRAQEVLGWMEAAGVRPNARTYASLMRAAAAVGDVARAREVLRMMARQGKEDPTVRPTAWAVNAALGPLVKRGQLAAALELREEMAALGIAPDATTCNALLDGYLSRVDPPRVREAEALFMEMLETGPSPDAYTFATLLAAYQPPPPPPPRARAAPPNPVDLLQRLPGLPGALLGGKQQGGEAEAAAAAAAAGAGTASSLSSASSAPSSSFPSLGILPGPDRVLEMVRLRNSHVEGPPLVLDTTAVNTLLVAYAREGAIKKALAAFDDFKRGNLTATATATASTADDDAAADDEAAAWSSPGRPDVVTYTVLVKGVAQTDNVYAGAKIMALYREMRGRFGVQPDLQLADALVNSFVRARSRVGGLEMEDLEEVFADLRSLGWRADTLARLERRAFSFFLGLYSEAWKEGGDGRRQGRQGRYRQPTPTTAEKLFEKYNWNRIDSGFFGL